MLKLLFLAIGAATLAATTSAVTEKVLTQKPEPEATHPDQPRSAAAEPVFEDYRMDYMFV